MTASAEPAARAGRLAARLPDFFIVGHAKSGTTALYEMLRSHPQIFMPSHTEPQFFARNPPSTVREGGGARFQQTGRHGETLEEYLSLFAPARPDQLVGEGSTFYLWSPVAPARIAQARPDAHIVAILREPASFLRSLHLQMVQNHAESERDLRKAMTLEEARRRGERIPRHAYWPEALIYSQRVRYVEQLRRYHDAFPREQVLVLIYDDFKQDNAATVAAVLRFLGVEDTQAIQHVTANPTVAVRSVAVQGAVHALRQGQGPVARMLRGALVALTSRRVRREVLLPLRRRVLYSTPRQPNERLMLELRRRFLPEVVALSEYLDRDLVSLWGYDDLD